MSDKEKIKKILKSSKLYARNFLKIKTKEGKLISLEYNSAQRIVDKIWNEMDEAGKPVRLIILKARREGISTYTESKIFHRIATHPYINAKVIAHKIDGSNTIFEMCKTFYNKMPETIKMSDGKIAKLKPVQKFSNRKELVFGDLESGITIASAGDDSGGNGSGVGRGEANFLLHCSEVAFWPSAGQTLLSLFQTVPFLPKTAVILESTANGAGGDFYDLWQKAKKGENEYTPIFIPWFVMEEYRLTLDKDEVIEPDEEEQLLIEKYNIDFEQLKWRRHTIANECLGDIEKFHQEYPADDQEAFIVSGRPFFDVKKLVQIKNQYQKLPIKIGNLEFADLGNPSKSKVEFIENPKGYISIWKEPKPNGCYCIGGDVAEGLENGDYSVLNVLDRDTFEQVAQWYGHIDADLLGTEAVKLGRFYNQCWIGIEVNNHGLTTNKTIAKLKYPRFFIRRTLDEFEPDPTDKLGWQTNSQSRPVMLDDLKKAMRDNLIIQSEITIDECFKFVVNEKGKPEAAGGCHDDTVMSFAITLQMHKLCPMSRPISVEEKKKRKRKLQIESKPISDITGW